MQQKIRNCSWFFVSVVLILGAETGFAQAPVGGDHIYEFLDLPASARITGLGGFALGLIDDDAALAYQNPAALRPEMSGQVTLNHSFLVAGIQHGFANYARTVDRWKLTWHGGFKYIAYGTFDLTDPTGAINGTFRAGEYALTVGAGKQLTDRYSIGSNLKLISSQLESYTSFGLAIDLAGMYYDPEKRVGFSILGRNIGTQITRYRDDNSEALPFDFQLAFGKRLQYLPFRIGIVYHNLHRWNIRYDDPNNPENQSGFFGEESEMDSGSPFLDNLLRHFVFNGEFLFGKLDNFRVRFGYNHARRQELRVRGLRSLTGFSYGVGIKIKRFRVEYGRANYHLGGGGDHLSISTQIGKN